MVVGALAAMALSAPAADATIKLSTTKDGFDVIGDAADDVITIGSTADKARHTITVTNTDVELLDDTCAQVSDDVYECVDNGHMDVQLGDGNDTATLKHDHGTVKWLASNDHDSVTVEKGAAASIFRMGYSGGADVFVPNKLSTFVYTNPEAHISVDLSKDGDIQPNTDTILPFESGTTYQLDGPLGNTFIGSEFGEVVSIGSIGPGTVDTRGGDDTVLRKWGFIDSLDCGDGVDTAPTEGVGTRENCEIDPDAVVEPGDPDPDPQPDPQPQPDAQPQPQPEQQQQQQQQQPANDLPIIAPLPQPLAKLSAASTLRWPSAKRCRAGNDRKLTVRVAAPTGASIVETRVQIKRGKKAVRTTTKRGTALKAATIDLRKLKPGRYAVTLRIKAKDGRTATQTRSFRTCATS